MSRFYLKDGSEVKDLRSARKVNAWPSITTVINACSPHEYKYLDNKRLREMIASDASDDDKMELLGNYPVFEAGSMVHEAAEAFMEMGIPSDPLGCPKSTKEFFSLLKQFTKREIEIKASSELYKTAGRIDLVGMYKGKLTIADHKTCSLFKKKPSKSWLAQIGGYSLLLGKDIEAGMILQFSKKDEGCMPLMLSKEDILKGQEMFIKVREIYGLWIGI